MSQPHARTEDLPTSERLQFRRWSVDELDLALGLWGDPLVMKYIDVRQTLSNGEVRELLERQIGFNREHGVQYWPIFSRTSGEHLGCCGLRPYDRPEKTYELGCQIRSAHWGRGFATEATRAVIRFAFAELGVESLFAGHNPQNSTSRYLMEKLRFGYTHDELYAPTGLMHPSYCLSAAQYLESGKR